MSATAVSILRVSTKKQLVEGEGIENQRRGNLEYIRRKGYTFVREFVIAETAEAQKRDDFEAAIRHVIRHSDEIDVVVFWKIDRISRGGAAPYYALKGILARRQVRVEFATEQIDESATGELMETLLAGMARFENRLRVDRTIGVEKILTREGYWCRSAPTGFRNARTTDGKPILLPADEPGQWELLCSGLRKQLTGVCTLVEVAREMREAGLKTNRGPLSKQTWYNICRNPVYGGLLRGQWTGGELIRAKFDGPLTPEEWQDLQGILDGRKRLAAPAPRQAPHPDFPLRRFLCCPGCNERARGYQTKGRRGKPFSYYDCQSPACAFRVRTAQAHDAFVRLLGTLMPTEPLLILLRAVVSDLWTQTQADRTSRCRLAQREAEQLLEEKDQLLGVMKRCAHNPSLLAECERDFARVDRALTLAQQRAAALSGQRLTAGDLLEACSAALCSLGDYWERSTIESRSRLQRLVFPEGLSFRVLAGTVRPQLSLLYRPLPTAGNAAADRSPAR